MTSNKTQTCGPTQYYQPMDPNTADQTMRDYYHERAPVYDRIYHYPERQSDLRLLEQQVAAAFTGRRVVEVAAGTGYWSQFIMQGAQALLATDATAATLDELRQRNIPGALTTAVQDAFEIHQLQQTFNGAFAGLWFSHIPVQRQAEWVAGLHQQLEPGALVMLVDNSMAQCEQWPLVHTDDLGNTYQERFTDSGETYRVVKNFPTVERLLELTHTYRQLEAQAEFVELEHFRTFTYQAL